MRGRRFLRNQLSLRGGSEKTGVTVGEVGVRARTEWNRIFRQWMRTRTRPLQA